MGPDRRRGLSTDLPASNPGACGHHHSTGAQTHTHTLTQIHTQMHSDNPSALAKCCLIQPDLHSTEKANSLPLTVWKTERSSHKWQRSELCHLCVCVCVCVSVCVCVCVCLCACACPLACTHVLQLMFFIFVMIFFSVFVRVCLHVLVVTTSSAVPPSLCDRQIARLLCSLLLGGCHQTLLVQPVMLPACVRVCVFVCMGVWETEFALCCTSTSSCVLMRTPEHAFLFACQ